MLLNDILHTMVNEGASDCYITVGAPSMLRINGKLQAYGDRLESPLIADLLSTMMNDDNQQEFRIKKEANFAYVCDAGRFRVSAFWQQELPGAVIRHIKTAIPDIDSLELHGITKELIMEEQGLILVVGSTGSGKSTSLAAMIGHRNQHDAGHILTVEDPIEFVHSHQQSIVTQREVGIDTESYEVALKNSLRQAPDLIMIGEIRSREVMEYALQFAETGHLCIATLHANNSYQAIERILHFASGEKREQFLFDLSANLRGIVAQKLIPDISGEGRHAAFEVLINTPNVSDLIRKNELYKLREAIEKSECAEMCTFEQSLFELYQAGKISKDNALYYASSKNDLLLSMRKNEGKPAVKTLKNVVIEPH